MDYQRRLDTLRERMRAARIDVLFLRRGAQLFYLTGIRRQLEHQTDHHAWGEWATGALIGLEGRIVVFAPRMGGSYYEREAEGKPWIDQVRLVYERDDPAAIVRDLLREVAGNVRAIAVDDRAWCEAIVNLMHILPDARFSLSSELVQPMRNIKSDEEIAAMRKAAAITDTVFEQTIPALRPGVTEFEVAEEIERLFHVNGADNLSFQTGVVFAGAAGGREEGVRARGTRKLERGDSVTFDFGCLVDGYCSDFGRSAFIGEPPAEYRRMHKTVLDSQRAAMAAMKAGQITTAAANQIARQVIAEAGYDEYFTHRLGHGIGVTVHEPPFLDVMDQTVLQENMTFTVEPSIRIPGGHGNRVEDVVMVTKEGGISLNHASHELTVID